MDNATVDPHSDARPEADALAVDDTVAQAGGGLDMLALRRNVAARLFPNAAAPASLGRFRVLEQLGAGAMGTVYAAWDPELERRVAIKVLKWSAPSTVRMKREAQALARLTHPNVITVHEVGSVRGDAFVAMEFVNGQTLRAVVETTKPAWREIVALYEQAAEGLAAAHDAGLVHRDFKPDNAMIGTDGRVRVLDFGLARPSGVLLGDPEIDGVPRLELSIDELTRTGSIVGTPAYMAPEQLAGDTADAKSDQFAWCVSLCEALDGERPWLGETLGTLLAAITERSPKIGSAVPKALARVLRRGLAPDPDARWPDMRSLLKAVRRAKSSRPPRLLAGGLAVLAVGAVLFTSASASVCEPAEQRLAGVWDADARARIGALDLPSARRQRFIDDLDAWTTKWKAAYAEACPAEKPGVMRKVPMHIERRACVDDLLVQARGLVDAFTTKPWPVMERPGDPFWPLPSPDRCLPGGPGTGMAPVPPEDATAIMATRILLERDLFRRAGTIYRDAVDPPLPADSAYPPLLAELRYASAVRHLYHHDLTDAEADANAALDLATVAGHDWIDAKTRLLLAELAAEAGREPQALSALIDAVVRPLERVEAADDPAATQLRDDIARLRSVLGALTRDPGVEPPMGSPSPPKPPHVPSRAEISDLVRLGSDLGELVPRVLATPPHGPDDDARTPAEDRPRGASASIRVHAITTDGDETIELEAIERSSRRSASTRRAKP